MKRSDADGESSETIVWINFAKDCGYLAVVTFKSLSSRYHEIGMLIGFMMDCPEKFGVRITD
jgi:four helix bundle protein